jgi:2-dehydropantoate 2-reductase
MGIIPDRGAAVERERMDRQRPIAVAGAGSIGCFVGGMLAEAGRNVTLLARQRVCDEIATNGLRLTSFEGTDRVVGAEGLAVTDDPAGAFRDAALILVAVKSADTAAMAQTIARHARADAVVVSLQNGVGNVAELSSYLPGRRVLAAMVPFNVVSMGDGRFHRASSGDIQIARDAHDTAAALSVPGLSFQPRDDIEAVQWGKLLINLNNALVALSGLTLREQLAQRPWRRLFADQIAEALAVMRAERVKPISMTPIPVGLLPHLLRLPDGLFQLILGRSMKIDPQARSSMWEDLMRRRGTEIDYLQGVIVGLAAKHGMAAPVNARVLARVKAAEIAGNGPPGVSASEIAEGR